MVHAFNWGFDKKKKFILGGDQRQTLSKTTFFNEVSICYKTCIYINAFNDQLSLLRKTRYDKCQLHSHHHNIRFNVHDKSNESSWK